MIVEVLCIYLCSNCILLVCILVAVHYLIENSARIMHVSWLKLS